MDQELYQRLQVYKKEGLASLAVTQFVQDILLWLEQTSHHACTEETTGPFASHLMLALTRVQRGETLDTAWDAGVHEEALTLSQLNGWVSSIQQQAQERLGVTLPDEEIDFVLLHLGTFLMHYNDPLVADIGVL